MNFTIRHFEEFAIVETKQELDFRLPLLASKVQEMGRYENQHFYNFYSKRIAFADYSYWPSSSFYGA